MPGVKPHLKVYTLPGTGGDMIMQGLDSLAIVVADKLKSFSQCENYLKAIVVKNDLCNCGKNDPCNCGKNDPNKRTKTSSHFYLLI